MRRGGPMTQADQSECEMTLPGFEFVSWRVWEQQTELLKPDEAPRRHCRC